MPRLHVKDGGHSGGELERRLLGLRTLEFLSFRLSCSPGHLSSEA